MDGILSYLSLLLVGAGGWVATHLIGKPFLACLDLRTEITRCLVLYANIPCSITPKVAPPPRTIEARNKYRELASQLIAIGNTIPFYQVWSLIGMIPKWSELQEAKGNLIGLSNSIGEPNQSLEISRREENVRRLLRIR